LLCHKVKLPGYEKPFVKTRKKKSKKSYEQLVRKLKKFPNVTNPWALAHHIYNKVHHV